MPYFAVCYKRHDNAGPDAPVQLVEYVGKPCTCRLEARELAKQHGLPHVALSDDNSGPAILWADSPGVWIAGPIMHRIK